MNNIIRYYIMRYVNLLVRKNLLNHNHNFWSYGRGIQLSIVTLGR